MFTTIYQFAHQDPFLFSAALLGIYMAFNAFVAGMPEPDEHSSVAYRWAFGSLHALAFNIDKLAASKGFPQLQPGQTLAANTAVTGADGSQTRTAVVATGAPAAGEVK